VKTRLLTGVPAALALLALIFWAPSGLLRSVAIVFGALAYWEFDSLMFSEKSILRKTVMSFLVSVQIFILGFDIVSAFQWWFVVGVAIFYSGIWGQARLGRFQEGLRDISVQWLGYAYVSLLFGFLFNLAAWPEIGRSLLLLLLLIVFLGDTSAYFIGTRWGKRKLAPEISPKKTVEGAVGAVGVAILTAVLWCAFVFPPGLSSPDSWKLIAFAPVVSFLAQGGDLFESILKRSQSQKDSGVFLPGHGGILDRVDGLAFATPVFYLFIYFFLEGF